MARNGSGTYSLVSGNPVTTGSTISSTWANNTLSDIATALTGSIAADGQTPVTANLPMGTFKHTGAGSATATGQYLVYGQSSAMLTDLNISGTGTIASSGVLNVSGLATFTDGKFALAGSSSGAITLKAPAIASTYTHTLPAATATIAGIDFAQTWTAKQTFNGSSSVMAMAIESVVEPGTLSATAATGTINYDVSTQSVLYYTSSAAANWTVNFRHSSGTALNTSMATGDILTVTFAVTQGSTAYYNSAVQVDGNSVTPKYGGGTAWSSGTASGIDVYTYTIIKTGSAAFTVLADRRTFA